MQQREDHIEVLDEVKRGDVVNLRVDILGIGPISTMEIAPMAPSSSLHVFKPRVEDSPDEVKRQLLRGLKRFNLRVAALKEGEVEIPAVQFVYFDTEEDEYLTVSAGPWRLKVSGTAANFDAIQALAVAPSGAEAVALQLAGDRPSARAITIRGLDGAPPYRQTWFVFLLALAPMLYVSLLAGRALQRRRATQAPSARARKNPKQSLRELNELTARAGDLDRGALYSELERVLFAHLERRFEVRPQGMTKTALRDALLSRGQPEAVATSLERFLADAGAARYAPGALGEESDAEAIARVEALIHAFEEGSS